MTVSPTSEWSVLKDTWVAFYQLIRPRIVVQGTNAANAQTTTTTTPPTAADKFTIFDQYDIDRAGAEFMDAVMNAEACHREDRLLLERARMRIEDLEAQLGTRNAVSDITASEVHRTGVSDVVSPPLEAEPETAPTEIDTVSDDGDGHAGSDDLSVESVEGDTIMAEPVGVTMELDNSLELLLASP